MVVQWQCGAVRCRPGEVPCRAGAGRGSAGAVAVRSGGGAEAVGAGGPHGSAAARRREGAAPLTRQPQPCAPAAGRAAFTRKNPPLPWQSGPRTHSNQVYMWLHFLPRSVFLLKKPFCGAKRTFPPTPPEPKHHSQASHTCYFS